MRLLYYALSGAPAILLLFALSLHADYNAGGPRFTYFINAIILLALTSTVMTVSGAILTLRAYWRNESKLGFAIATVAAALPGIIFYIMVQTNKGDGQ